MGIGEWIFQDWFNLLSAIGIVGGLCFNAFTLRSETKTRRVANLLSITANHREIWQEFLNNPELSRVRNAAADPIQQPLTDAERIFVTMVILHVNSVYYATNDHLVIQYEGLRQDIGKFFSLPIPKAVWEKSKQYQNADFVGFMDAVLK